MKPLPGASVELEEAPAAASVVAHSLITTRSLLDPLNSHTKPPLPSPNAIQNRPVHTKSVQTASSPSRVNHNLVAARLHAIVESMGTGFLYGTLFGGVLAVVDGYRESPQHQRLSGILHHGRIVVPQTAGRIALVTGLFRLASWGLDAARGHDHADLVTVL